MAGGTKFILGLATPKVAKGLEGLASSLDNLTEGMLGFSKASNESSDNFGNLLEGLTKMGAGFGEVDKTLKNLFPNATRLNTAFGGLLPEIDRFKF